MIRNLLMQNKLLSSKTKSIIEKDFYIKADYLCPEEEKILIDKAFNLLRREKFENNHFDNVIVGYRERNWSWIGKEEDEVSSILKGRFTKNVQEIVYEKSDFTVDWLPFHILHLKADGKILPHIDNKDYSGSVIAGLSLISGCTVKFEREDDPEDYFQISLPARSLYVQKDDLRYQYKHSIFDLSGDRLVYLLRNRAA